MELIRIGTSPYSPGKYPLTKMLIDSDIDGIISGAMLKKVYPEIKYVFGDPGSVQEGKFRDYVDQNTAVVDLPYIKGCGFFLDHHLSNKPQGEIVGCWSNTPSAARLVYDYFKADYDLTNFAQILADIDTFDSGLMKLDQVVNPPFGIKLAWAVERRDMQFFEYLMQILPDADFDQLANDPKVQEQISAYEKKVAEIKAYIPLHIEPRGVVVFVDLRDSGLADVHIAIIESQLMDYDVVVNIKSHAGRVKFSLYQNNLLEKPYEYDLLSIAKFINPEFSGGHKKGCGFAMPEHLTIDQCQKIIVERLNRD